MPRCPGWRVGWGAALPAYHYSCHYCAVYTAWLYCTIQYMYTLGASREAISPDSSVRGVWYTQIVSFFPGAMTDA